jgi:hypothetical protein
LPDPVPHGSLHPDIPPPLFEPALVKMTEKRLVLFHFQRHACLTQVVVKETRGNNSFKQNLFHFQRRAPIRTFDLG